jgi:lipid-binding SYLF domain-containing protein
VKTDTITIDKILATIVVLTCLFVGYLLGGCVGKQIIKEKTASQEAKP